MTKRDYKRIGEVAKRACNFGVETDYLTISMDIECLYHTLDIDKLLGFNDLNFSHDVFGIYRNLNRSTKQLENCFLPRCSK